jgi:hypothetical protein
MLTLFAILDSLLGRWILFLIDGWLLWLLLTLGLEGASEGCDA